MDGGRGGRRVKGRARAATATIAQNFHTVGQEEQLENVDVVGAINNLDTGLQQIRSELLEMRVSIRSELLEMRVSIARALNASCSRLYDILTPIPTQGEPVPPGFPNTLEALMELSEPSIIALLTAYGLPVGGTQQAKRRRLIAFIGVRS